MKLTKITLATVLGLSVITSANATGIPVVDGAAIAQNLANHIESIANMAKQLAEAKKQLQQLKQQYEAITGNKGYADVLKNAGISKEMLSSFDDLVSGSPRGVVEKAQKYFESMPDCKNAKDKVLCSNSQLAGIVKLNFAENLDNELNARIKKVEELSQRAQHANDSKSMQELIANINLENNAIALLKQKAENFERLQAAQEKINSQQAYEKYISEKWAGIKANEKQVRSRNGDSNLSDLIK